MPLKIEIIKIKNKLKKLYNKFDLIYLKKFYDLYYEQIKVLDRTYKNEYVEKDEEPLDQTILKPIAFYLPQFHPIEENDKNWGKGFTEWTNVTRALPQFKGHYQPRLPGELGFYDLRLDLVQRQQIALAKHYGIYGFCLYYYWFNGKVILDTPLNNIIKNKELNFPFCLCWANENWTRRWDGQNEEIILKQEHSLEDDFQFFKSIAPILKDKRYIRVKNKPLLIIYKPCLFPDPKKTTQAWRNYAQELGIGDIYLMTTNAFNSEDYKSVGFDGIVQFPPHKLHLENIFHEQTFYNKNFSGKIYNYSDVIKKALEQLNTYEKKFPGIMLSWDNTARRTSKSSIFHGCDPSRYEDWLKSICDFVSNDKENTENIFFINAWNEWAEGTYLEPDKRLGYAYLEKTKKVIARYNDQTM